MPRQGQSVESCILVEWLKDIGDSIDEGTPVASIETRHYQARKEVGVIHSRAFLTARLATVKALFHNLAP